MMGSDDNDKPREGRWRHIRRSLLTLGAILLAAVFVGIAAEVFLRAVRTASESGIFTGFSLQAPFSLALSSLQAALPIVGALVAAPLLAAHLLHDLEATDSAKEAHDRLNQFVFGALGREPKLEVREGRIASGRKSVAARAGGPASLSIHRDTAVVTEHHGRLKRILGQGTHSLERYEKVWALVDLRTQQVVREVFALTKEGMPISCEIDVLFEITDSLENEKAGKPSRNRTAVPSYDYVEEAVLRAATSKWVDVEEKGKDDVSWTDRVVRLVESELRDILATYRLDWLIEAPRADQQHPRDEIHERLKAGLEEKMRSVGAKLLNVELGQMQVAVQDKDGSRDEELSKVLSDIVSTQWIDAWNAEWKARALTSRAEGEAELLRMDVARIEAQAEMAIALAEALQPMMADEQTSEPYLLALRLVEALRWMAYDPGSGDFMPPEAMRTLKRLRALLDSEDASFDAAGEGQGGGEIT